jgi:GH43 family beta-xylosidase
MLYYEGITILTNTQGNCFRMWKAPTVNALKSAKAVVLWKDNNPERSDGIWAPEISFDDGRWYLYYTAMAATRLTAHHRMHVLESTGPIPWASIYTYKDAFLIEQ